jgi:hypothetical protein
MLLSSPSSIRAAEPPLETINFAPSSADFANPERGFFNFRSLTNPTNLAAVRAQGHSLIYGEIYASNFRNGPLSQTFLNQIQAGFNAVRSAGLKVKFRVSYSNNIGVPDAPKSVILNHIQQLQPLWEANKDVIYLMDAGFIGAWGEWHSSTNGLDNNADRTEILSAILDALPVDRMVGIRTPHYKREIFNGSPVVATNKTTAENAFDGSDISRVGHLNDCFLASGNDFGTYIYQAAGWTRQAEIDYIGSESRYGPHGGETCADSLFCSSANALSEMQQLHTDYLHYDYNPDVIQRWKNEGSFDEISKRLGYRYELQTASLPNAVKPSGLLEMEFTLDNVGFGELFNPRNVEITLKNNTTGEITSAPLEVDPRYWSGGTTNTVYTLLGVPADMAEGTYTLGIKMPDIEASLANDVRYSIRFANEDIWEATTGINVLKTDLQITSTAPGALYQLGAEFEEIIDTGSLLLAGDFDADGDVDGRDLLVWQSGFGELYDSSDLAHWQANYGQSLPILAGVQAVPEPTTLSAAFLAAMLGALCRRHVNIASLRFTRAV